MVNVCKVSSTTESSCHLEVSSSQKTFQELTSSTTSWLNIDTVTPSTANDTVRPITHVNITNMYIFDTLSRILQQTVDLPLQRLHRFLPYHHRLQMKQLTRNRKLYIFYIVKEKHIFCHLSSLI